MKRAGTRNMFVFCFFTWLYCNQQGRNGVIFSRILPISVRDWLLGKNGFCAIFPRVQSDGEFCPFSGLRVRAFPALRGDLLYPSPGAPLTVWQSSLAQTQLHFSHFLRSLGHSRRLKFRPRPAQALGPPFQQVNVQVLRSLVASRCQLEMFQGIHGLEKFMFHKPGVFIQRLDSIFVKKIVLVFRSIGTRL